MIAEQNNETLSHISDQYARVFKDSTTQAAPRTFRSPGRINLIGEHTDYNHGFVLPASVDKAVYFVIAPREDDQVLLHAVDLNEDYQFSLNDLSKPSQTWAVYQLSIIEQIHKKGLKIKGFQAAFGGDVPLGAGLSSSAALECCLLFALNEVFELGLDRFEIVKMAQKAENEYVGVQCGIMDQFASTFGQEASVIRLDCRSLDYAYFPFPMEEYRLVLCDTQVKHSLADSAYNTRRQECEQGVATLREFDPNIASLRDVSPELVAQHRDKLGEAVYMRCKYITEEIKRVEEGCQDLVDGDLKSFGRKMYETHQGLQHEYLVSCPELDFLVDQTLSMPEVLGARMMGGGFGGCTINLVAVNHIEAFEAKMKDAYRQAFNIDLPCYKVRITEGTNEVM
ncbi:galactokinase [Dyadobacter jejuensis]|uniref:Galactokinase n=1 Tax=Dyadobacter jejuensis TaxID=1082580 RepID=A0A316AIV8_9BACT|nr:galactokinase [Dyadobacter jejuensis]PWJ57218.1 galactokinase [Dyadobacter jejuensis]